MTGADGDVRISAIDIGSNSIRQIVADVSSTGAIRVVDEMKAAPRLGSGIHETGELSKEAGKAAIEALGRMDALSRQLGASVEMDGGAAGLRVCIAHASSASPLPQAN